MKALRLQNRNLVVSYQCLVRRKRVAVDLILLNFMTKKESDTIAPKRKVHRKKRESVAKKHTFKKNKKAFYEKRKVLRTIKADKDELRKLGLISKEFAEKVHADEILMVSRMIGKLLEHDQSAERDLIELFTMIDSSCSINLRKMTDSYV
jgi:hypothetical protein